MPKRRSTRKKIENWQTVVDHVNDTWKAKKKVEFNYPWSGKDIQDLAHQTRNYQPWGIMALWDLYLQEADEWTTKQGLSIFNFIRQLPRLLDRNWKVQAGYYERKLTPPLHRDIAQLPVFQKKFNPQKRRANQSRLEWLRNQANKKPLKNHII